MKDVSLEVAPTTKSGADAELIGRARAVLEANWLGHGTSPSLQLYPHQWSWDAACIAMGYASWNQSRAEQELRSLFAGQWRNGLLPHIVFTEGASYFPGPDFWQTERSAEAPERPRTSGIVQPPIHATAAWQVYVRGSRPAAGDGISRRTVPAAAIVARVPLSGAVPKRGRSRRDLAPVGVGDGQLPALGRGARADVAGLGEHPGVRARRRGGRGCSGAPVRCRIRPLRLSGRPVPRACLRALANPGRGALRAPAGPLQLAPRPLERGPGQDRTRARFGRRIRSRRGPRARQPAWRACGTTSRRCTWTTTSSPGSGWASPRRPVSRRCMRAYRTRAGRSAWSNDSRTPACPSGTRAGPSTSLSPGDPGFQPTRYWRGPVWPILNWVLQRGLERYGYRERAEQVRQASRRPRAGARASGSTTTRSPARGTAASSSPGRPLSSSTSSRTAEHDAKGGGERTLTSTAFLVTPA